MTLAYRKSGSLLTVAQHDEKMVAFIASGNALPEPEPGPKVVKFSGIACPRCGFCLRDLAETKADPDGNKFRRCGCDKCGNRTWRRTP